MIAEKKTCLSCSKNIHGRIDKKFCDDYCRNRYNNQLNGNSNLYIRNINQQLRKNRRILESLLPEYQYRRRIPRQHLFNRGYRFNYFTHTHTNRKGKLFYCCYEYAYLLLDRDRVLITKRRESAEEEL